MGGAFFIVLIGVPIGLFMLLGPKKMWWALDSWKYKNPEANEPSDTAYGMTALGGLALIIGSIFCAAMFWSADNDYQDVLAKQQADKDRKQAIKDYVPPKAQDRGPLPFIGYTVEAVPNGRPGYSVRYEVYFLHPDGVYSGDHKGFGGDRNGWYNCVTRVGANRTTSPPSVSGHISWEPAIPPDDGEADRCTVGDLAANRDVGSETMYLDPDQTIVTDSAIVDTAGKVVVPAKAGNVLPKLATAPR